MRQVVMACVVAAALGGCAVQADTTAGPPPPDGGASALAVFGTPFLIVAKVPVCLITIVMAAPVGAASELSDPATPFGHDLRQNLSDGISQNCGPPYAVTP